VFNLTPGTQYFWRVNVTSGGGASDEAPASRAISAVSIGCGALLGCHRTVNVGGTLLAPLMGLSCIGGVSPSVLLELELLDGPELVAPSTAWLDGDDMERNRMSSHMCCPAALHVMREVAPALRRSHADACAI
jgi:hypothetical protein